MSKYTGVTQVPGSGKYRAQINRRSKIFYLGVFEDAEAAARQYDRAVNLTRSWELRPTALNFEDGVGATEPPAEEFQTELERGMLETLRNNFPIDEGTARQAAEAKAELPDVLMLQGSRNELEARGFSHRIIGWTQQVMAHMRVAAKENAELKAKVAFQAGRIEDLQKELAGYTLATMKLPTAAMSDPRHTGQWVDRPKEISEVIAPAKVVAVEGVEVQKIDAVIAAGRAAANAEIPVDEQLGKKINHPSDIPNPFGRRT